MNDIERIDALRKDLKQKKANGKSIEKRPRHYADEIIKLPKREDRAAALAKVPEEFKAMVKVHVETYFLMRKKK